MLKGKLYQRFGKRALDLAVAVPALAVTAPLLGALALAVRTQMGGPALFRQERPGIGGRPFLVAKLRTMSDVRGPDGALLADEQRLTPLGRLLRKHSLDELPQFWSVVKGDMSLVGPRPLLTRYLSRYTPEQARRHEVKPGITGWAQVNGRNTLSWEQKFAHDVWYVDHVSLALDLEILARTALKVLHREGIAAEGHATMPEFLGSEGHER